MKKWLITTILVLVTIFVVSPINTRALTVSDTSYSNVYVLDSDTKDLEDWLDETEQEQDCSGANSLLGNPEDEESVAWLLQQVLNFIKVIGPILVVVLSSIDFIQVIVKSDDEAMAKARKKLITRLILAALLFFIPTLVQVVLDLFGFTTDPTCGIK